MRYIGLALFVMQVAKLADRQGEHVFAFFMGVGALLFCFKKAD